MMKKWNRLAALVLALVLALSAFTTALAYQDGVPANEFDSYDYEFFVKYAQGSPLLYELLGITDVHQLAERLDTLTVEQRQLLTDIATAEQADQIDALIEQWYQIPVPYDSGKVGKGPSENFTKVASMSAVQSGTTSRIATFASRSGNTDFVTPPAGVQIKKTASEVDDNGEYTITLEAYTTGTVTVSQSTKPTDIVLVLDVSGSMAEDYTSISSNYVLATSNSEAYQNQGNIYIKDGDQYKPVTITATQQSAVFYTYTKYTYSCDGVELGSSNNGYGTPPVDVYVYTTTRPKIDELKSSVKTFLSSVNELNNAIESDANKHRVALVKFAGDSSSSVGNGGYRDPVIGNRVVYEDIETGLDDGILSTTYNYSQIVCNLTSSMATVSGWVDKLHAAGATAIDYGLAHANNVLSSSDNTRNKVVIVFTDGEPNHGNGFSDSVANAAISSAGNLKADRTIVYTICIANGAAVNAGSALPENSGNTNKINRFMHLVSSNYPSAASMTSTGTGSTGIEEDGVVNSFYLTPSNTSSLTGVFQQITTQLGSTPVDLNETTEIRDVVADHFVLPQGNETAVSVSTQDATYTEGVLGWTTSTIKDFDPTVTIDGKNVTVEGFSFKDNYVAENGRDENDSSKTGSFHGRKLIISFKVKADPTFFGGKDVPTNTSAGIYDAEGNLVGNFEVPDADVPLNYEIAGSEQNIYLTQNASLDKAIAYKTGFVPNGSNNEMVNIDYYVMDGDQVIDTYTIYAGDDFGIWASDDDWDSGEVSVPKTALITDETKTYTIKCEVSAVGDTEETMTINSDVEAFADKLKADAKVNVFKPELTFKDSEIEYGDEVPDSKTGYSANLVSTVWKHNGVAADTSETGMGAPPVITLVHTPDENELNADKTKFISTTFVKVDVEAYIGTVSDENKITTHVTFEHQDCGSDIDCDWSSVGSENGKPAFLLHVSTGDLIIEKRGFREASESAIVTVTHEDGQTWTVVITGNNSVTLKNVPAGLYTVTEDTNWSYRYEPTYEYYKLAEVEGENILIENTAGAVVPGGKAVVTNAVDDDQWLGSDNFADNHFTTVPSGN